MASTAIYWCQRDLRLADNPALAAACERHAHVVPVYIHAPDEEAPWAPGAASRWWLHHSLAALQRSYATLGAPLLLRAGDTLAELRSLITGTGAVAVYWNRLYEPALRARNQRVKAALRADGIEAESFGAALLIEPWQIRTGAGDPYRVFTPFYKALLPQLPARRPLPAPAALTPAKALPDSLPLEALGLLPTIPWDSGLRAAWTPGEAGAQQRLEDFCDDALARYAQARDLPADAATSRLSPYLHFGEITPAQVHVRLQRLSAERSTAGLLRGTESFLREVIWREFAHHLLFHFPQTPTLPLNPRFAEFPWRQGYAQDLRAWQRGQTGLPIVDAGLRELWHTGYMHNRVRMIVGSLLTKNLLIPWQEGARWFWDTLVDADLANNTLGWQWIAGCGADAAPYFRIFNPVLQSRKFDPQGAYLRRWLPELKDLDDKALHAPWEQAPPPAGYPAPCVDLAESRARALAAYEHIKSG
jgi:deoxyribodipyrimidine photo-lyase